MICPIAYLPFAFLLSVASVAFAQTPSGPPSVGVVRAEQTAITETSEFIGRMQAIDRVALTARVTAFLEERLFTEGAEVKKGDLLYRLERAPFEAAVQQQEAAVADTSARLANANIQLARAQSLLSTPAGQRSNVDDAIANQRSLAAQVLVGPGAVESGADQPRLHRNSCTGRRQDQPDQHHRRQRRVAEFRAAGNHRQPGSDVCAVSGGIPRA